MANMNIPFITRNGGSQLFGGFTKTHGKSTEAAFTEDQIRNTLKRFDDNNDGVLNKKELKNAFNSLGSRCAGLRASLALHHADKNGDGQIDQKEMEKLVQYALNRGYTIKVAKH